MQQKTYLEISGAEVVVELALRVPVQAFGGLDFQDQSFVHHHVESLAGNLEPVVADDCVELPGNSVPSITKLDFERSGVHVFPEAKTQLPMDGEERPDDRAREFLVDECHSTQFQVGTDPGDHRIVASVCPVPRVWRIDHVKAS